MNRDSEVPLGRQTLRLGAYVVEMGQGRALRQAAQTLRTQVFRAGGDVGWDADPFDDICHHVVVSRGDRVVACCRALLLLGGQDIQQSYSAQFYDLAKLEPFDRPMLEVGRFCAGCDSRDPDILRALFAALTAFVDAHGVELMFGCSSFPGTQADDFGDAFSLLSHRHLAPRRWMPGRKACETLDFVGKFTALPDVAAANRAMPGLLRSYLSLGGWVSDHAVVDRDLSTLHVFTGVEVSRIPQSRRRLFRADRDLARVV